MLNVDKFYGWLRITYRGHILHYMQLCGSVQVIMQCAAVRQLVGNIRFGRTSRLILGLSVFIFSLVLSTVSQVATVEAGKETHLSAATYNLRSQRWDQEKPQYHPWSKRMPRVKAKIYNERPDIVGMQEVIKKNETTGKLVGQRSDVIKFMSDKNYGHEVGSVDNSSPVFWNKDKLKKTDSKEYLIFDAKSVKGKASQKRASRYLTYVRLEHKDDKQGILVFNYHFNQFEQTDHQLKKLAATVSKLKTRHPKDKVIFTGDFNNKHSQVISRLKGSKVKLKASNSHKGIDQVLVSPTVKTRSWSNSGLGKPAASDHPMITSRLTL